MSDIIIERTDSDIKAGIEKAIDIESSALEIDATSKPNVRNTQRLLRNAANGVIADVTYIVSGDSTRNNTFNEMISYYTTQLSKIGVLLYNNASSGQSANAWLNNDDAGGARTTLQEAIDNTIGVDGDRTILEYSFGLNDYDGTNTKEQIKGWIRDGINAYLAAKPKATVILSSPVKTNNTARNTLLQEIYSELSTELELALIDTFAATDAVQGNTDYYQDGTHPNKFGSRRIVNYIFNDILPLEMFGIMTLEQYDVGSTPPPENLPAVVESGLWSTSSGAPVVNPSWRRLQSIDVEPNFTIWITHQGNRRDANFVDINGNYVQTNITSNVPGEVNTYETTIPLTAAEVRFNISSDAAAYDPIGDVPVVRYADPSQRLYLSVDEVNNGLTIRNVVDNFRDGALVDSTGSVGSDGQRLTKNADGDMVWETP